MTREPSGGQQGRNTGRTPQASSSSGGNGSSHRGLFRRLKSGVAKNKDIFVVTIALVGGLSGLVTTVRSLLPSHPAAPSDQIILNEAEGWATTYSANFGKGFSAANWSPVYNSQPSTNINPLDGGMQINVNTEKYSGGYAFFQDNDVAATLPAGDFYMSATNLSEPHGCEYGLLFNVDTNNRFGWLYVDTGGGTPLFGIDVSVGRPTDSLVSVLPETVIDQPVNTIGILRYGDKYIAAINGHAVAEVSAAKLSSAAQTSLTGSEIGIGTFTTFQRTDQYELRTLSLQAPTDLGNSTGGASAQASG